MVYVYGHDALAQAKGSSDPNYFIYDGHGSVRHLATSGGAIAESYNYDAYGNVHGFSPANAATALLYCGEMFDNDLQHYYLRARWYNPLIGRFNRLDPFAGDNRDPESLHKYLYCHANPVNYNDPSGMFWGWVVILFMVIALVGIWYWSASNRGKPIHKLEIYLSPGTSGFKSGVLSYGIAIQKQLGAIVESTIIDKPLPTGTIGGYDGNAKVYRIVVSFRKDGVLGYTIGHEIAINTLRFDNESISQSVSEKSSIAANVLLHEVVHSIYDHISGIRTGMEHEQSGLMVGPPFEWSYDISATNHGLLPFSRTTEKRLEMAVGKRF